MSINIILEDIKDSPSSIIQTLSTLHNDKSILTQISKSDLNHLISRTLQLCRSSNIYNKWSGINIMKVISSNYVILANEGSNFVTILITILENFNSTIDVIILKNSIECLNKLMKQIRNKPTLTREILTPKLNQIIQLYIKNLHFQPTLIINSLYKLIKYHPNTFRPFANKFNEKLTQLLSESEEYPIELKNAICKTIAILPIIERNEPELKWYQNVLQIIKEIVYVIEIYEEFFHFDTDLKKLIAKLPRVEDKSNFIFEDLSIDFNKPSTISNISTRIEILIQLLTHYLTESISSVKIPIGMVLVLTEVIFSINSRYLSFKNDVRDEEIKKILNSTLLKNFQNTLKFLNMLLVFKGALVLHLPSIWSNLEMIIPINDKKISKQDILNNEQLFRELLNCASNYLQFVGTSSDNSYITPLVDVALILIEPRKVANDTSKTTNNSTVNSKKKKKNISSAPLSDILSHEHLFNESCSESTLVIIQTFFNQVIKKFELPPTQHYKILKFIIKQSIEKSNSNLENTVPESLQDLLISAVLNPGYDKNNILPIVSSILSTNQLLTVFNNPRLPPLPKYVTSSIPEEIEDAEEDNDEHVTTNLSAKENAIRQLLEEKAQQQQQQNQQKEEETNKRSLIEEENEEANEKRRKIFDANFKPNQVVSEEAVVEANIEKSSLGRVVTSTSLEVTEKVEEENVKVEAEEDPEGSDFEMPELNLEEDTDEEGEEED
ncbi:RIX1 [Candida pseudojiufengensis]|uniref:RIX1 n=1 Tax=Candida pseudojiufengensis TaxID=497109 RepID=UPI0022242AF9|nr:RIX1 [Candida pseudojiufengensis]KAI5965977.1 RIX1 [Candida pseudojiufengensis]